MQVLEQAPEFKEIGAGIQLGPNVFRMFEVLGLTEQMFHWCAFPEGLEFRDSITGETIVDRRSTSASTTNTTRPTASSTAPTCSTSSSTPARNPT